MKKILILIAILFATITVTAQDYNRWAISGEFGNQMVADESAVSVDKFNHFGLGVRYNLNEIVGIGLTGGYDFTSLKEEYVDGLNQNYYGQPYDFEYGRVNLEGYINVFKAVDLYSKRWTILFHGGPGASFIKTKGNRLDAATENDALSFKHKETVLNLRGGASLLYKVSKSVAVYGDFTTTSNVNQVTKFDGSGPVTNAAMSALVTNISVGLKLYLGKKGREHADWYVAPPVVLPEPIVNNTFTSPTTIIREEANCDCDIMPSEFVFFNHDEDIPSDVGGQGYKNAIFKTFKYLIDNPNATLTIRGYASPTSSSDEYNMDLSNRRAIEITKKFVAMGISKDRIKSEYFGKDNKYNTEFVHDVARRVELIVQK